DAFVQACLAFPDLERFGVWRTIKDGRKPSDPDRFVDAFARVGLDPGVVSGLAPEDFGRQVAHALGDKPTPERLRRVAAAWRTSKGWIGGFVTALVKAGVKDEASLL